MTYCGLLVIAVFYWKNWGRVINRNSTCLRIRRFLVSAYWVLTFTILVDALVSLKIPSNHPTQIQFKMLTMLAFGTLPQIALFALVATPVVMRDRLQKDSFVKALIFMEVCAIIVIVMLGVGLILLLRHGESSVGVSPISG
jgi:hypothetical protein